MIQQIETNRFLFLLESLADEMKLCLDNEEFVSFKTLCNRLNRINQLVLADKTQAWALRLKVDFYFDKLINSNRLVMD